MELDNDEVRYTNFDDAEYLEFKAFDNIPDIKSQFLMRGTKNIDYVDESNLHFGNIVSGHQVHGDNIARVDSQFDEIGEADALITNVPDITLVIRVADCIAVQVYDPVNRAIANIHSGWKGTLLRITPKTIRRMGEEYGTKPEDVIVVLCPSIGPDHFEVMEDVRAQFEAEYGSEHIVRKGDEHFFIDSPACVVDSLTEISVKRENIHLSNLCTVCHNDLIHSYRGNIESEKMRRNASIIYIM